ncbi:hypothetical protein M413DRAFT_18543 [Hebeloma cylindrosporum]|uniref:RRM domain-containing protein n=1 Tax=Hebeloma cylindrosporum TaxID=76867 RepID=A0A0C2XZ76_HEBCY|nr:hypothetical protein M413DRAFT_18543 [Hebeloma cylindrosporum h7]
MPVPSTRTVNTQTKVLDTNHGRILCIADIRGRLSALNDLAPEVNAKAIIHTGDFGFFEANSLERINDRTLRHLTMYSPLIPSAQRTHLLAPENPAAVIRSTVNIELLSEFPLLLAGQIKLQVPVYTVWGACEDVLVLEKFRSAQYSIDNLHVLDEATTRLLDVGGVKLRLLGLGGALVPHKLFDNGDGSATIAGAVDTAQRVFDQSETRLLVTHASPGREGIISQLALVLKADLTVSAGLHFRYATSYNEFSVQPDFEGFRHKLALGKDSFDKVWESVKIQVDAVIDDNQRVLLDKALSVIERLPPTQPSSGPGATATGEEPAWKNCWNWNLCDAAYGSLVLDVKEGRVSAEMKSQGFNYAYRRTATVSATPSSSVSALPAAQSSTQPPTKGPTPVPDRPLPPHLANKSTASTPPPPAAAGAQVPSTELVTGKASPVPNKPNGSTPSDKAEKEKAKRKEKKERKDKERATVEGATSPDVGAAQEPSTSGTPDRGATPAEVEELKSPVEGGSTGARTPKTGKPPRHPWTIFMRMAPHLQVVEADIREFFGDAKVGITRVNLPHPFQGKARLAYVEFGDEDAMKAGLEKHAGTLKDTNPDVKQATDRESRGETPFRGFGRGRGGRGGGYAARGLAAAGLSRGSGPRSNGDVNSSRGGDGGA